MTSERTVRTWSDWNLCHLGGNLYELRRLIGTSWVRHTIFTVADDNNAMCKIADTVAAVDLETTS